MPCPSIEQLEDMLTADRTGDDVNEHVNRCESCRTRVTELRANNELFGKLLKGGTRSLRLSSELNVSADQTDHGLVPGYEILGEIHSGGQGVVYEALQTHTKRTVALKLIHRGRYATSKQRARFEREIELVAGMQHPHIVTVYDSGVTPDGELYLAMQYIDGLPLDLFIQQNVSDKEALPRTALECLLRLFAMVCQAVNHAHQRGIFHRDLKPANILVDENGDPHLLDFGLAKLSEDSTGNGIENQISVAGEFMGTLAYSSPEQTAGRSDEIDIRTDVYSLGVIFYEALTKRFPYPVNGPIQEIVSHIINDEPTPLRDHHRAGTASHRPSQNPINAISLPIEADLETIILKALAKQKDRRYQTAGLLAQDLEAYLDGEPIDARRDSTFYILTKMAKRYRTPVTAGLLAIAMLVVFAFTMTMLYRRSVIEADKARQTNLFLQDTLASVEPAQDGSEVSVREVLDDAAMWIEIALTDHPEVEAAIRSTIGNSYRSLGSFDTAYEHLSKALETRIQVHGYQHPEVAQSINALALLENARGNSDKATRLGLEALTLRQKIFGKDHLEVGMSHQNLGYIHRNGGNLQESLVSFDHALKIRQAQLGERHGDVAMVWFNIGITLAQLGRVDEAIDRHEKALSIRRSVLPENHPDLSKSLLVLGELYLTQHHYDRANEILEEALSLRRMSLGEKHWKTAEVLSALGECLTAVSDFEKAEQFLATAIPILKRERGPNHVLTRKAIHRITTLYSTTGIPQEATALSDPN